MNEHELRALVRDAIARHQDAGSERTRPGTFADTAGRVLSDPAIQPLAFVRQHASHGMFVLPAGVDTDGPCIIEPAVTCNHCGYCKSYGH
jgi:hypothetical protein